MTQENKSAADVAVLELTGWILESYPDDLPPDMLALTTEFDSGPDPRPGKEDNIRPSFPVGTYYGFNPRKALAQARMEVIAIQSETAALQEEIERLKQELQTDQIVKPMMNEILLEENLQVLAAENLELRAEIGRLRDGLSECSKVANSWGNISYQLSYVAKQCKKLALSQPCPTGFGDKALKLAVAFYNQNKDHAPYCGCSYCPIIKALTPDEIKILEGYGDE